MAGIFDDLPGYSRRVEMGERPSDLVWSRSGARRLPDTVTSLSDRSLRLICTPGLGHSQLIEMQIWADRQLEPSSDDRVLAIGQKAYEGGLLLDERAYRMVLSGELDELEELIDEAISQSV